MDKIYMILQRARIFGHDAVHAPQMPDKNQHKTHTKFMSSISIIRLQFFLFRSHNSCSLAVMMNMHNMHDSATQSLGTNAEKW